MTSGEARGIFLCYRSGTAGCAPCRQAGRQRAAVALCDGPRPDHTSRTCDTPLCGEHRHRVGPIRDLCPRCARQAAVDPNDVFVSRKSNADVPTISSSAESTLFDQGDESEGTDAS
jgi:hypothetical protein